MGISHYCTRRLPLICVESSERFGGRLLFIFRADFVLMTFEPVTVHLTYEAVMYYAHKNVQYCMYGLQD